MKVGTDGVLLGAWCSLNNSPKRILDVGTGGGTFLQVAENLKDWRAIPLTWPIRPRNLSKRPKTMVLGHSRRHSWTRIPISIRFD